MNTIMKKMMMTLIAMLTMTVSANAMSFEQARNEALFLTDKMAYELNLTDEQYEAAYEINLDYLMGVTGRADVFGPYWERRNLDLSYILLDWQWEAFLAATYFYRPLYWDAGYWHFRIYARYPHRDYFYFGRPHFYATYRGGHAWHRNGGRSYFVGRREHFRNPGREHFGMHDRWNRGDFRNGGHSSTRITAGPNGRGGRLEGNRGGRIENNRSGRIEGNRGGRIEGNRGGRIEGNRNGSLENRSGRMGSTPNRSIDRGGSTMPNHSIDRGGNSMPNRSIDRGSSTSPSRNFGSGSSSSPSRNYSSGSSSSPSRNFGSSRSSSSSRSFGSSSPSPSRSIGSSSSRSSAPSRSYSSGSSSSRSSSFGGGSSRSSSSHSSSSFGGGSRGGGSHSSGGSRGGGGGHFGGRR